jgi:hypothetical protein
MKHRGKTTKRQLESLEKTQAQLKKLGVRIRNVEGKLKQARKHRDLPH